MSKQKKDRVYNLLYKNEGDAGITFTFECLCGNESAISENPWWDGNGHCFKCGRDWSLNLFVEADKPAAGEGQ